jgi:hypothetical protein
VSFCRVSQAAKIRILFSNRQVLNAFPLQMTRKSYQIRSVCRILFAVSKTGLGFVVVRVEQVFRNASCLVVLFPSSHSTSSVILDTLYFRHGFLDPVLDHFRMTMD